MPPRLVAKTPAGHHQLDFLSFSGFSCSTASVIPSPGSVLLLTITIGRIAAEGKS